MLTDGFQHIPVSENDSSWLADNFYRYNAIVVARQGTQFWWNNLLGLKPVEPSYNAWDTVSLESYPEVQAQVDRLEEFCLASQSQKSSNEGTEA